MSTIKEALDRLRSALEDTSCHPGWGTTNDHLYGDGIEHGLDRAISLLEEIQEESQPTTALAKLEAAHMAAAAERWDNALALAKRLFHPDLSRYAEGYWQEEAKRGAELARRLLTVSDSTRFAVLGFDGRNKLEGYSEYSHGTPVLVLEFISFFIGHEIIDDGSPAVGYYIYDPRLMYQPCGPDHPKAMPYFHRNIDLLWETRPNAEHLDCAKALEILEAHEERDARIQAIRAKRDPRSNREPSETERLLRQLAGEI